MNDHAGGVQCRRAGISLFSDYVLSVGGSREQERERKRDYRLGLRLQDAPQMDDANFVGRRTELKQLRSHLLPRPGRTGQSRATVRGLGGMGKTRLAIKFARENEDEFRSVFWLNARSETLLRQSLVTMMRQIPHTAAYSSERPHDRGAEDRVIEEAKRWLSDFENRRWLLIFDNYDEPYAYDIEGYFPYRSQGSILVTTRSNHVQQGIPVDVKSLESRQEGLEVLVRRSGRASAKSGRIL